MLSEKFIRLIGFPFIAALIIAFTSCGTDQNSTDDIPPQAPVIVPRTPDDAYPQQGIRAEPVAVDRNYWIRLEWYPNTELDIEGYVIRRIPEWAPDGGGYPVEDLRYGDHLFRGEAIHHWIDKGYDLFDQPANLLAPDIETGDSRGYYWTIYAYDFEDNRSVYSDTVYYRLIHNPTALSVTRLAPNEYSLSWNYTGPEFLSYYKIRVFSAYYGIDSVKWDYRIQRYGSAESITLGEDGNLAAMVLDCTYVWQLNPVVTYEPDSLHRDSLAGASVFTIFTYQD